MMTPKDLRGAAAIVGIAESDLGDVGAERHAIELAGQAAARAVANAGLTMPDIDGLFGCVMGRFMSNLDIGEYLGIRPRYSDSGNIGGSSFISYLYHAAAALHAGLCDAALIVYGSTPRADGHRRQAMTGLIERPTTRPLIGPVILLPGTPLRLPATCTNTQPRASNSPR